MALTIKSTQFYGYDCAPLSIISAINLLTQMIHVNAQTISREFLFILSFLTQFSFPFVISPLLITSTLKYSIDFLKDVDLLRKLFFLAEFHGFIRFIPNQEKTRVFNASAARLQRGLQVSYCGGGGENWPGGLKKRGGIIIYRQFIRCVIPRKMFGSSAIIYNMDSL